jgi:negative regulator of sigma E activity
MSRLFLGPIKNPTWKDFVARVGGAAAVIVVVIFGAQAFIPGHEGIAVIVASLVLIAFVGIQEVRHNMQKNKSKQGRSRK